MYQYSFYNVSFKIFDNEVDNYSKNQSTIQVGRFNNQHNRVMGGKGEMVVTTHADFSGYINFTLLQTSKWNNLLYDWCLGTHALGLGLSQTPFVPIVATIQDHSDDTHVAGMNGVVTRPSPLGRGQGISDISWSIEFQHIAWGGEVGSAFNEGDQGTKEGGEG